MTRRAPRRRPLKRTARWLATEPLESRLALDGHLADFLPRFGSPDALREYLLADALQQYSSLFDQPVGYPCWEVCYFPGMGSVNRDYHVLDAANAGAAGSGAAANVSTTNVQVAGVDEADIVEADADHLYVLGGWQLAIVDAHSADGLQVTARVELPGRGVAEFLYGDRLTVVTMERFFGEPLPMMSLAVRDAIWRVPFVAVQSSVTVTVFDVSDPAAPRITEQSRLDGAYHDARAIDDKVIVIVSNENLSLPPPEQICSTAALPSGSAPEAAATDARVAALPVIIGDEPYPTNCVYESREVWQARIEPQIDRIITDNLPHFTSYDANQEFVRAGLLHEAADLVRPVSSHPSQILSVVTFDVDDADAGILAAEGIMTGWNGQVYASRDALIVSEAQWNDKTSGSETRLLLYLWDPAAGALRAASTGVVPGSLLNSFAIDVFAGTVRVATTTSHPSPNGNAWTTTNHLFVLETIGPTLDVIGELTDFGTDERIQGVRFLGDTAFVVTFRQIDPLFTVDLSVPSQPRLVGELEMPGFSQYLQMLDDRHLLGLGSAPGPTGDWTPRLVLFDVSDLAHPRLLDEYFLPPWSSTIAAWDHHAVLWNDATQTLALPVQWSEKTGTETNGEGYSWEVYRQVHELLVWQVDLGRTTGRKPGFSLRAEISHDDPVLRGVIIGDRLYSLSYADLKVVSLADPTSVLDTLDLFPWPQPDPPWIGWTADPVDGRLHVWDDSPETDTPSEFTPSPLDDAELREALDAAMADLADRLSIDREQVRLISVEPHREPTSPSGSAAATGFQLVLGVGASQYLYVGDAAIGMELADETFEFPDQPETSPWHNAGNPLDTSGDGEVAAQDALIVVNELNAGGARELRVAQPLRAIRPLLADLAVKWFWDVDGDRFVAPQDVLRIINWLNERSGPQGEGEAAAPIADDSSAPSRTAWLPHGATLATSASPQGTAGWSVTVDAVIQEASDDPLDNIL